MTNAKAAITENPDYFAWWYTVKSVGLAAAVGAACYYAGKSRGLETGSERSNHREAPRGER